MESVPFRRPEAADARVLVLVEALENAAGVHMDGCLRDKRREKKFFQRVVFHDLIDKRAVRVDEEGVLVRIESPLAFLNVAVIARRVVSRDDALDFFFRATSFHNVPKFDAFGFGKSF